MNLKAENFKTYLAQNNINYFRVEETEENDVVTDENKTAESGNDNEAVSENHEENLDSAVKRVTFHTFVKVFGQKLPSVVIIDDSIYTTIRVQVIPDIEYNNNRDEFMKCINEMNITYKAIKYYLNADNALYLDMYIPSNNEEVDGDLVINLISAINRHLEKEYPNWMKLLWG